MPIIPQLFNRYSKSLYKRGSFVFILICLLMIVFKYLIFDIVIPKTATLTVPAKWRMLPLRQSKTIVHAYLGDPIPTKNPKDSSYEEWVGGTTGKMYFLRIDYGSDTVATGFSIRYHYQNRLSDRNYLIDTFSIR